MVYIEENRRFWITEIEEHPVAPGDAEGEGVGQLLDLLDVEAGIPPVSSEAFLLASVEPPDFLREFPECALKLIRLDYLHTAAGG